MKTNEALASELVLIPQSITCPRCQRRIDVARCWTLMLCPCGKAIELSRCWWVPK